MQGKSCGVQSEKRRALRRRRRISKFLFPGSKGPRAHPSPHTLSAHQNGRSLRCRPRPQQGPRGLHRQGRQHQLHDGVAAPRQQVRLPARPRARVSLGRDDARFKVTAFSPDRGSLRVARRDRGVAPRRIRAARRPDSSFDRIPIDPRRAIALSKRCAIAPRRLRARRVPFCRMPALLFLGGFIRSRARARAVSSARRTRASRHRADRGRNRQCDR